MTRLHPMLEQQVNQILRREGHERMTTAEAESLPGVWRTLAAERPGGDVPAMLLVQSVLDSRGYVRPAPAPAPPWADGPGGDELPFCPGCGRTVDEGCSVECERSQVAA